MTTKEDYAALAAISYNNERGFRSSINRLELAIGWTPLFETAAGFPAQPRFDRGALGFTGGAYINASGEIVIAYVLGDKTDGEYYVELQYHGQDYLEGGGREGTLYGGMGEDRTTIKSIATCASKQRAMCRFHCKDCNSKRLRKFLERNLVRFSEGAAIQREKTYE